VRREVWSAVAHRDRRLGYLFLNVAGALVVAFTLHANLTRGLPIISLAAAVLIVALLYWAWAKAGKPRGVRNAAAEAEAEEETSPAP
jgi:hypothetical protein